MTTAIPLAPPTSAPQGHHGPRVLRSTARSEAPSRPPSGAAGRAPRGPAGRRPGPTPPPARIVGSDRDAPMLEATHTIARLLAEVECGRRSLAALRSLLCPRLEAQIAAGWAPRRSAAPRTVQAITGQRVAPRRFTAVAVLSDGHRCGALHLELAVRRDRWVLVAVLRPEDPALPEPAWTMPSDDTDDPADLLSGAAALASTGAAG